MEEIWHCLHQLCLTRHLDFWQLLGHTFPSKPTTASSPTELEPNLEVLQYRRLPHQTVTGLTWSLTASLVTLLTLPKVGL